MARLKSLTGFGVKLALTGGILWFVLQLVDLAAMRASFAAMNWAVLGAALLQMLIIPLLGGVRWKLVLVAMRAKGHTWPLSRLFWISMLFGQVLPSTVGGDVVRVFMMWRSSKSLRIAFNSVALERASMLLTLLLFVALQLAFLDSRVVVAQLIWIALVPLLGGIIGLIALMCADHVLKYLPDMRVVRAVAGLIRGCSPSLSFGVGLASARCLRDYFAEPVSRSMVDGVVAWVTAQLRGLFGVHPGGHCRHPSACFGRRLGRARSRVRRSARACRSSKPYGARVLGDVRVRGHLGKPAGFWVLVAGLG